MRACYVLRVFTTGDEGGNHLGVIADATGLDAAGMQEIAADLAFSETVFFDWNQSEVPVVRIFTPARELAFAGHPLVGSAWVLTTMAPGDHDRLACGIGEVRFSLEADGRTAWLAVPVPERVAAAPDGADLAAGARLPVPVRAWWVESGKRDLILETVDPAAVAAAAPDFAAVAAMADGVYVVAPQDDGAVKARFFAPALGIDEDPATGSAAVALAAAHHFEGAADGDLTIHQGAEIGFPSTIRVRWGGGTINLGGTVVKDEVRVLDQ